MQVHDQLHGPAALPLGKVAVVHMKEESGWTQALWRKETFLTVGRNYATIPQTSSP